MLIVVFFVENSDLETKYKKIFLEKGNKSKLVSEFEILDQKGVDIWVL